MERIRSEREKALSGEVFRQGDPEMAKRRKRAKHLCFLFNHTDPDDEEGQKKLLEELIGSTSGEYCITAPFYCDYTDKKITPKSLRNALQQLLKIRFRLCCIAGSGRQGA